MRVFSADQVARRLPYDKLMAALRDAFTQEIQVPLRALHHINQAGASTATLGMMPAWQAGEIWTTKIFTLFPDNVSKGVPTIHAQIMVFDGQTGVPIAVVDGTEVTRRRTAAASALAASYLAREESEYLLVLGTGPQALHQALAHAAIRPIRRIGIWGRDAKKARSLVQAIERVRGAPLVAVVDDLAGQVRQADVISCATAAAEPIISGQWLKPGAFLDLVGSHMPDRRECDDDAVRRSRIFVDTRSGALAEAGDILMPLRSGVIRESDILGDLHTLCRGTTPGRVSETDIHLFKSVGTGLEDLAAARLIVR